MASWGNEVEKSVNTVVPESGVTLDSRLFGENIIILAFEVSNNLWEAGLIIDLISESGCVDDGEWDACAFLIELEFLNAVSLVPSSGLPELVSLTNGDRLDAHTLLEMSIRSVIGVFGL
jgi:hypothetical protein